MGELGRRIATDQRISDDELERRAGLSAGYASSVRSGRIKRPSAEKVIAIAEALGQSVDEYLVLGGYAPRRSPSAGDAELRRLADLVEQLVEEVRELRAERG